MENREAIMTLQAHVVFACEKAGLSKAAVKEVEDALDTAISALEKQEPMKPMAPELDPLGGVTHPCGNCGGELVSKFHDFCPWCGQAVKWEK